MTLRKTQQAPRAPSHLSAKSKEFWKWCLEFFVLENHHLNLLRLLCEASDRCEQARQILDKEGITTKDRFGRVLPHPCVAIERDCRVAVARLTRELDLDASSPSDSPRPPALKRYK